MVFANNSFCILFSTPFLVFHFLLNDGSNIWLIIIGVLWGIAGLALIISIVFSILYPKSIEYQISEKMITTYKGVITRKMKNVPISKITNVDIYRGLLDRILNIGTIVVHTAGYSGTVIPEKVLEGLENYNEILEQIMKLIEK